MPLAQKFRPTGEFMTKFDSFSQRIAVSPGEKLYLLYKDQFMVFPLIGESKSSVRKRPYFVVGLAGCLMGRRPDP